MSDAIFLSASVPDPVRAPEYAKTADSVAITAAVTALVHVTLGRRLLVWGGHPAITPMIWVIAEDLGLQYASWVKLYQSQFFKDEFPEDNERFHNVVFTEGAGHNREESLLVMRKRMFRDNSFGAAIFIGGMHGIVDEFELFRSIRPTAKILPISSTGGAVVEVARRTGPIHTDMTEELDYVALFHRHLEIPMNEQRYQRIEEQPVQPEDRLWTPFKN